MSSRDVTARELAGMISRTVKLASKGDEWFGLCPFHSERTPSFHVYQDRKTGKGKYHCFGCGAHGDAIDWRRRVEGKTYREAGGGVEDPEVTAALAGQRRYEEQRQRILNAYRDRNPDCIIPDWAIDTTGDYP